MKLIATRHAETNYNIKDLVNYDPSVDVHLTEKGIKQAAELAETAEFKAGDSFVIKADTNYNYRAGADGLKFVLFMNNL